MIIYDKINDISLYYLLGFIRAMVIGNSNIQLFRKKGFYEKYIKRFLDIICAIAAILFFSWLFIIIGILVKIKLGSPIIFKQLRPGQIDIVSGNERIFYMYKFRTMTDEKDLNGDLLPDSMRLTKFGKWLRSTSLDELPEAFNILKGDMSVIGPRPQLVKDMVFMSLEQRMRHTARPGLSGLAQVSGRNALSWNKKLQLDIEYINNISFREDLRITFKTINKAFLLNNKTMISSEIDITEDFGDYLLRTGYITKEEYIKGQSVAKEIIDGVK